MGKLLTVSVAAYNVENFLKQTLQSLVVPEQMERLEVLIEDDGSTDGTAAVAEEYVRKWPETFHLIRKENGGYGSTINRSIAEASGKYFRQLDGDDWFDGQGFAAFLKELDGVDADCVISSFVRFTEGDGKQERRDCCPEIPAGNYRFDELHFPKYLNMHSLTYRTAILKKMPRRITEHCFYTDLEFVHYPLPYVETAYVTHHPVYVYRVGREGQSVSTEGIRRHYREHERVLRHLLAEHRSISQEKKALRELMLKRLRIEVTAHMKYLCMLEGTAEHGREFRQFVRRILRKDPEVARETSRYSHFARAVLAAHGHGYLFFRSWYQLTEGRRK